MSLDKEKTLRKAERFALRGNIPAAIDQLRKVVEADPADLNSANTLGELYVRAGEIRRAIIHFTQIAAKYRERGFALKAIGVLKKIARLDETNIEAATELAGLYCERRLFVEARRQYLQIAEASERTGQPQKVREAFQKIAELEPSNTFAPLKLAELCERDGLMEEARDWLLMAAETFASQEDHDRALEASLKALELCPDSRPAVAAVSSRYTQQGLVDLAIDTLAKALDRNSGDIDLRIMLGRTYMTAGLAYDAENVFKSLVESCPDACNLLIEVGQCFLDRGEPDDVIRLIETHLDVLIEQGQLSGAIELLKLIHARDATHLVALKQLAQIFQITDQGEELCATLTALAETAAEQGADAEATEALDALELLTARRRDQSSTDTPHVTTGDTFEFSSSIEETEPVRDEDLEWQGVETFAPQPASHDGIRDVANENVLVHLALKEIYQQAGSIPEAATKCLELARMHEARGESSRATEYLAEAHSLTRSANSVQPGEPSPKERAASRSGIIVPQVDLWRGKGDTFSLRLGPVEYNLAHDLRQLACGESPSTTGPESSELRISSDAIAELDERFQACSGRDTSTGEIYEAYRLAIGSLTRASQHGRVQTDAAVRQKLSRAYLTVVEAFSSLLCIADGFEYEEVVDGGPEVPLPDSPSTPLSQRQFLQVARDIRGAATVLDDGDQWANRRKVERYARRLPVLVTANSGNWRELTESLDVSALGMRFRLSHPVEPGTPLRIQLAMPEHLRLHRQEGGIYAVRAVVCHQVEDSGGSRLVGAEFGSVLDELERSGPITVSSSSCRPYSAEIRTASDRPIMGSKSGILAEAVLV